MKEIKMKEIEELEMKASKLREAYLDAGADYVIYSLAELDEVLNKINYLSPFGQVEIIT